MGCRVRSRRFRARIGCRDQSLGALESSIRKSNHDNDTISTAQCGSYCFDPMPQRLFSRNCLASRPALRCLRDQRRTLVAAPSPNDGPLMTRRADRALPPLPSSRKLWFKTFPIFLVVITASALAIFNYQKASSSIVNATLYALRTSDIGKRELGEQIYFRDKFPWIWGEMNQLHGRIDVTFGVKGTKGSGMMRFRSIRKTRMGFVSGPSNIPLLQS